MVDETRPGGSLTPRRRAPLTGRQVVAQVAVAAVILVSGIAIGGGGTILALRDRIIPRPFPSPPSEGTPAVHDSNHAERLAEGIVERWRADYGLSDEQVQEARQTLAGELAATEELHRRFRETERTQREVFAQAIRDILTPEQYESWEADFRRMVEHMERMRPFMGRRGGRGGPPGERRPDWSPDRHMDPNDHRMGRPPGPPRDPNARRGDGRRDRFMGPDGRRSDRPPDQIIEPNDLPTN